MLELATETILPFLAYINLRNSYIFKMSYHICMEENHRQKLDKSKAKSDFWPHNCGISISSSHVLASSYLISSCSNCAKPFLLLFLACRWFDPMSTELRKGTPCMIRVALFGAETILMGLASTSSCSSLPPLVWRVYFFDQSYILAEG